MDQRAVYVGLHSPRTRVGPIQVSYARVPLCEASHLTQCSIRPANGEDLYWFDKLNVGIYRRVCLTVPSESQVQNLLILIQIALKAGRDVQERENVFRISEA